MLTLSAISRYIAIISPLTLQFFPFVSSGGKSRDNKITATQRHDKAIVLGHQYWLREMSRGWVALIVFRQKWQCSSVAGPLQRHESRVCYHTGLAEFGKLNSVLSTY